MGNEKVAYWLRIILDFLLILFTGGVMFATWQYSDTSKKSQRPWVGPIMIGTQSGDNVTGSFTISANTSIDVTLSYRNYGLTPALRSTEYIATVLGNIPPQSYEDWKSDTAPTILDCHQRLAGIPGVTLFPNPGSYFMTAHEPYDERLSLSTSDTNAVKAQKKTLFLVGCIGYFDQWGVRHYTDVCAYFVHPDDSLTGSFANCPIGNQAN
jgi:hypothetical protein